MSDKFLFPNPSPALRPWIKVCGMTDPDNAKACAAAGIDALGLVFYGKSPRNVSVGQAVAISKAVEGSIPIIGVFVDADFTEIADMADRCGLAGVQLHGRESPDLAAELRERHLVVIKTLFLSREPGPDQAPLYDRASFFLLECGTGPLPGGNARAWPYEQAARFRFRVPLILAGGLDSGNVADAIQTARPWGVDVSSGVEKSPGIKDPDKIRTFIAGARLRNATGK